MTAIPTGVPAPLRILYGPPDAPKAAKAQKAPTKRVPKVVAKKKTSALHNASREAELKRAKLTGRIAAARVPFHRARYDQAPYETRQLLRTLQPVLVSASSLSAADAAWLADYETRASKVPETEPNDLGWFDSNDQASTSSTKQDTAPTTKKTTEADSLGWF